MADTRLSALTELTTLADDDDFVVTDTSTNTTSRITAANLATGLGVGATTVGFYGTTPIAQQTGVAVDAAGIHAALVALGLITA